MMTVLNYKLLSDEQLVKYFQDKGDQRAYGELYNRYYLVVVSRCFSFAKVSDDAHDLAQDIMIKVLEKLQGFKSESKFSTWLYAITFNHCTDYFRKNKIKQNTAITSDYDLEDDSAQVCELQDELMVREERAIEALQVLSAQEKEMLILKYKMDKSIEELQSIFSLSASAVKMRLLRARTKANDQFQRETLKPAA